MSQHHMVAVVQEDMFQDQVDLGHVLARLPTQEIIAVLNSEWAKESGWQTITPNTLFSRQLTEHVKMEFRIGGEGDIRLVRRAEESVCSSKAAQRTKEFEAELAGAHSDYNLFFNEVLGQALIRALRNEAHNNGYDIVDERTSEDAVEHVYDFEMKLRVYENA